MGCGWRVCAREARAERRARGRPKDDPDARRASTMATAASAGRGLRALMRAAALGAPTAGASTARSVSGRLLRGAESSSSLRARATPATTRAGPASGAMRGFACGSAASLTRRSESARAEDGAATSAGPGAASEGDGATSPGASDAVAAPSPLRRAPPPRSAMRSRLKDGLRDSTRERVRAIQKRARPDPTGRDAIPPGVPGRRSFYSHRIDRTIDPRVVFFPRRPRPADSIARPDAVPSRPAPRSRRSIHPQPQRRRAARKSSTTCADSYAASPSRTRSTSARCPRSGTPRW